MKKIGKSCKVIDIGETYDMYSDFAEQHELSGFKKRATPTYDKVYRIKIVQQHPTNDDVTLCVIEDEQGNQFIIDRIGIKII